MKSKSISATKTKREFSKKLFNQIKNKQGNQTFSSMDKLLRNINRDLDSADFEDRKLATDAVFKLLPYILPRESSGNGVNVLINNNGSGVPGTENILEKLADFTANRLKQIEDVEMRRQKKLDYRLKEIKSVAPTSPTAPAKI